MYTIDCWFGAKRGVSTIEEPAVRNRWLAPSWSMIASRLMRFAFGPVSLT